MSEDAKTDDKPRRNWTRIALIVSLIVNLLFVGLMVGAVAGKRKPMDRDGRKDARVLFQLGPYGKALPDPQRQALIRDLRPQPGDMLKARRELKSGFETALDLLRAPQFDGQAFSDLLGQQHNLVTGRLVESHDALVATLETMSAAERSAYADALQEAIKRGPRGGKPDKDKRP